VLSPSARNAQRALHVLARPGSRAGGMRPSAGPPACDGRTRGAPRAGYHYTFDFLDDARVFTVRDNWCA